MATEGGTAAGKEGAQDKDTSPSTGEDSPHVLRDISSPLNFSRLSPSQFGISVQSFTPASSGREKSRLAQIKARRRSSVGVRGSPETNSLIRFMAQQKRKNSSHHKTPELAKSSPFLPRVSSTLRQKMASFQSLMDVEESEVCDAVPRQDNNTGGCIKTRDNLSDVKDLDGGKENHPRMSPTPSKRRRVGQREGCEVEIREAHTPTLHFSVKAQKEDEGAETLAVTKGLLPSSETAEEAQAVLTCPPPHADIEPPVSSELQACSPTNNQQDSVFEAQSPSRELSDDLASASPAEPSSPVHTPPLQMKHAGEDDSSALSAAKTKKRVHFGGPLTPEFFDKNLPPSTPLQKGGTPARAPTPGGSLILRSVLKTPQRSDPHTSQDQRDVSSPTEFGSSPALLMPRSRRMAPTGEDEKILFPSLEQTDSVATTDAECLWDAQAQLNLTAVFQNEPVFDVLTEYVIEPSSTAQTETLDELVSLPEDGKQPPTPARTNNRRKKPGPKRDSATEAPAPSSTRKRKLPEESQPVKRSTRSAAKSASGKMKVTSASTRRWSKDVNRSLYGSREYASRNPTLSPITERLSLSSQSPAAQAPPSSCTASSQSEERGESVNCGGGGLELAHETQEKSDVAATNTFRTPSETSLSSSSNEGAMRRGSKLRVTARGSKKRKVSVEGALLAKDPRGQTDENRDDKASTCPDEAAAAPPELSMPLLQEVDGRSEGLVSKDACPASGEELYTVGVPAETAPGQSRWGQVTSRGRRSTVSREVEKEQDRTETNQPGQSGSSSDSHEGAEAALDLAPWQAEFNFEDVFKPVATRGQRSVRRSLRIQSSSENSSRGTGLAWLPQTSPDSTKVARRRMRSRRLSAALSVQPALPEEAPPEETPTPS
ncbi:cell division cycle-associated protein 2 [Aulostomus maculatus]